MASNYGYRFFKAFLPLLVLFVFLNSSCILAKSCVCGTSRVKSVDQRAVVQLNQARQHRDAGNMNGAALLWAQSGVAHKCLHKPAWLNERPSQLPEPPPMSMEERLARISLLPYELASILLDDLLQREPGNLKVRQLYLNLATTNGDKPQITRHQSFLSSCSQAGSQTCLWYAAGIILLALIIFQLVSLYRHLPD